jgi:hypothetical protein
VSNIKRVANISVMICDLYIHTSLWPRPDGSPWYCT